MTSSPITTQPAPAPNNATATSIGAEKIIGKGLEFARRQEEGDGERQRVIALAGGVCAAAGGDPAAIRRMLAALVVMVGCGSLERRVEP